MKTPPIRIIFLIYLVTLFALATLPINNENSIRMNHTFVIYIRLDHLLHGTMMFPYVVLHKWSYRLPVLLTLIAGLIVGIVLEGIQYILVYRSFNINDLISNLIGVVAGLAFFFILSVLFDKSDHFKHLTNRFP